MLIGGKRIGAEPDLESVDFFKNITQKGTNAWDIQTYLRLRRLNYPVSLSATFERDSINVAHYDTIGPATALKNYFIVGIRADRDPIFVANLELCQNQGSISTKYQHFMPHWNQPCLVGRNTSRGTRVENLYYFGIIENLAVAFKSDEFLIGLEEIGVKFVAQTTDWWDYSEVDVSLAVRNGKQYFLDSKPATKLINSWAAGCPALLGPELAYREVGTDGENYIEVADSKDIITALVRLKNEPQFYEHLMKRGFREAQNYNDEWVAKKWIGFLSGPATEAYDQWTQGIESSNFIRTLRMRKRIAQRKLFGYQYYPNCDEDGNVKPERWLGRLRRFLFRP